MAHDGVLLARAGAWVYDHDGGWGSQLCGAAPLRRPGFSWGIAADALGNVYVSDARTNLVRKVLPNGTIATVAGGHCIWRRGNGHERFARDTYGSGNR